MKRLTLILLAVLTLGWQKQLQARLSLGEWQAFMAYDKAWRESGMGKALVRNYAVKEAFLHLNDDKLNSIIHSMQNRKIEEISVRNLVIAILNENPQLAKEMPVLLELMR